MKGLINILVLLALLMAVLPSGCQRRSLDSEYYNGALVQVNLDWGATSPKPIFMKIIFFPADGKLVVPRLVDTEGEQVRIPYDRYHALLYNWRSNDDVQSIRFESNNSDTTFRAYTDFMNVPNFTDQALLQPDSLYAWASGGTILSITRNNESAASAVRYSNSISIDTKPISLVKQFNFFIPVEGLEFTAGANAVITGVTQYKNLFNGSLSSESCRMMVAISREAGGIRCHFSAFGFVPNVSNILTINFRLIDGSIFTHIEDLSDDIKLGYIRGITKPILVPYANSGGFRDPSIGNWQEVFQPIEF